METVNRKVLRSEVEEITWKFYEGHYGEHQYDIDILLTYIEDIQNRFLTLQEKRYKPKGR